MFAQLQIAPALSLVLSLGLLSCGSAEAMAKRSIVIGGGIVDSEPSAEPRATPVHAPEVIVGSEDYKRGYELGHRNGSLISHRLSQATLGTQGCSALSDYQHGLLSVARSVKPPKSHGHKKDLTKGFFRGYLDAVRASIQDAREGCSVTTFQHGGFAGELYGSLLCQVANTDLAALKEIETVPLYHGWSGGILQVKDECLSEAEKVLALCDTPLDAVQSITERSLNTSCSDE